jgi:chromosome segregation ATPase
MKLIAGWLLAQGAALANAESPTETQVLEALQKLHTAKAGEVTSLGNEKSTLAGENAHLKSQISSLNSSATALENERADLKAQIGALKSGRATTVVDLAIARGKLNVAERGARIEALGNAQDFDAEASALLASATRYRTAASAESGKILSNQGAVGDPREEYCASVERHMKDTGETDPIKAHHAVMQRNPGLAEKLKVRSQF